MAGPRLQNPGGILGLETNGTQVRNVGKTINLKSSDDSIKIIPNDSTKSFDFKVNSVDTLFECSFDVAIGDLVYASSVGGLLEKARSDSASTMPAIGIVMSKYDAVHCTIDVNLIMEGLSGVLNNTTYFVSDSVAGGVVSSPITIAGRLLQPVAVGVGSTKMIVNINPSFVTRRS